MVTFIRLLSSGFGAGYVPKIPGTVGSLWGLGLAYLFRYRSLDFKLLVAVIGIVLAILIASMAEKVFEQKDCPKIVVDEIIGQFLAFLFVPFALNTAIFGFVLFRYFDIAKFFPANWAQDRLPGGYGIVGDDVVAGLQAALVLVFMNKVGIFIF